MKKKKIIVFLLCIIIICIISTIMFTIQIRNMNTVEKSAQVKDEFSIETKEDNNVLVRFYNEIGIQEIKYPSGDIVFCNGKSNVAIDCQVEKNQKYEFILRDINNQEKEYEFITPEIHMELTENDMDVDLDKVKNNIKENLTQNFIAINFLDVGTGKRESIDSNETDLKEILNNWNEIGTTGKWNVVNNSSLGKNVLRNTANQDNISGFYSPNSNYTDIDFSFKSAPNNNDNDIIGMLR